MTTRAEIETLLRNLYAARVRSDLDAICRAFTPDARFELASSPLAGPPPLLATGVAQFRPAIAGLIKTFDFKDHAIVTMVVEGEQAAVRWRSTIRSSITGETVTTEVVDIIHFANGRIAAMTEFCDTALAARLMGQAPAAQPGT
jgi:ketosteroid isomerase-like protein